MKVDPLNCKMGFPTETGIFNCITGQTGIQSVSVKDWENMDKSEHVLILASNQVPG